MVKNRKSKVAPREDFCPIAECMSYIGGAWMPHIVWHLSEGPRRFSELKLDLRWISPKVLTDQLKKMEGAGLLLREVLPTRPPTVEYSLTEVGMEFKPLIEEIARVGKKLRTKALRLNERRRL